jgi:hypothetical protein
MNKEPYEQDTRRNTTRNTPPSGPWHGLPDTPREAASGDVDASRVWLGVAMQVWRREPSPLEQAAARLLRSPGLARALVITPSLLLGWFLASVAVVGAGVWATAATGTPFVSLLAPPLAASGIAFAYGPGIDPAWELSRSMAVSDRMVLLARALAVFALNALLGVGASLAAAAASTASAGPHAISVGVHAATAGAHAVGAVTFGWLLPMTAVCALSLAVACVVGSSNAGLLAGLAGWAVAVLAGGLLDGSFTAAVTDSAWTVPYLFIALCCGAVAAYALRDLRGTR